jgi:hypothetical protein
MSLNLRRCLSCNTAKPIEEYYDKRIRKNPKRPPNNKICPDCRLKELEKPETFFRHLLYQIRGNPSRADLDPDVTVEFLLGLLAAQHGKCAITGRVLTFKKLKKQYTQTDTNASIDRIDSSGHYSRDNVRLVTSRANIMKNSLPDDEFFDLCKDIVKGRQDT